MSGTAPILLRACAYNSRSDTEVLVSSQSTLGSDTNTVLRFGNDANPQFLTRLEFSSAATFALDDLAMGLFDIAPGVPEPASWIMLIAGLGLTGAAMRRRQTTTHRPAEASVEIGPAPRLRLRDRHPAADRIVRKLVLADPRHAKITAFGMREIKP